MAKTPDLQDAVVVTAAAQKAGQDDYLRDLTRLMHESLKKQLEREAEREAMEREAQKANALMLEQARRAAEEAQNTCSHLKPNSTTNVVGQWDHNGTTHYMCQTCQKMWTGNTLPAYLRPPEEAVGGPVKLAKT